MARLGSKLADAFEGLRDAIEANAEAGPKPRWIEALNSLASDARTFGQHSEDEDFSYLNSANGISSRFRTLREDILGGIYLRWLKDLANPTKDQLASGFQQVREYIQPRLLSLTSATLGFTVRVIIGTAILIVCVFFFLYDGPGMVTTIMALIPWMIDTKPNC